MKLIGSTGREDLAVVYIAETSDGKAIEFVEALQPPLPRSEKWVVIVSTLFGCPVKCSMCDAGHFYGGKLSKDEILAQIDFLVKKRYPDLQVGSVKFKVQFARMGDPAFNASVLDVLDELPSRYDAPGLMPCLSTVAPRGTTSFFDRLLDIKKKLYKDRFQLQFSLHTTDESLRNRMIPVRKWTFGDIARYGERFFDEGGKKIALNFALDKDAPVEEAVLTQHFDPAHFIIKITPLNPTYRAIQNRHESYLDPLRPSDGQGLVERLCATGYEIILSMGEADENHLGSNCGQLVLNYISQATSIPGAYSLAEPGLSATLSRPPRLK
ncbi:MAG: radical SAM protein [Candidatus Zixiibacteriota bacterium]|nr:MAG: radical SAM protein [candidate division Zixibacteria bacterium]